MGGLVLLVNETNNFLVEMNKIVRTKIICNYRYLCLIVRNLAGKLVIRKLNSNFLKIFKQLIMVK